jgi:hypothetical protein
MIRFVHCVKRRPEISDFEFRRFWSSQELEALINQLFALLKPVRARRTLVLAVEANQELMREREGAEPYDGLLEIWFDNSRDFEQIRASAEYQRLMREIQEFQAQFVDFTHSARFFTEWFFNDGE